MILYIVYTASECTEAVFLLKGPEMRLPETPVR